jgi:hypothetical protein
VCLETDVLVREGDPQSRIIAQKEETGKRERQEQGRGKREEGRG